VAYLANHDWRNLGRLVFFRASTHWLDA